MTGLVVVVILASVFWVGVVHGFDRASVPAWQAKYAYRLLSLLLLLALAVTSTKALMWHTELVEVIRGCR